MAEAADLSPETEAYFKHVLVGYNKGIVAAAKALEERAEESEEEAAAELLRAQELRAAAKVIWDMVKRDG